MYFVDVGQKCEKKADCFVEKYSVSCKFWNVKYKFGWVFLGVYRPNDDREREH